MAEILYGGPVADALNARMAADCEGLKAKGIVPTLAILRVGEKDADLSYERGAMKRCDQVGVAVKNVVLPVDVSSDEFFKTLDELNNDPSVHGILMFRPLPEHIDSEKARCSIAPEKDVDGCTDSSLAGVFTGRELGFPPCTAQAVIEMLKFYNIDLKSKNVAMVGHSLVVGRPCAAMCTVLDATVDLCQILTKNTFEHTQRADIIIVACGKAGLITPKWIGPNKDQIVIDVGINVNAEGKLCGDVAFDEVEPLVAAISPVPKGVGSVTTSVLVSHVVDAALRTAR